MEKINLLIVDDNIDNILALEASLEQEALSIFTTTSPKEVLELCKKNDISIALVDVRMPEIDGFELLDLIKSDPLTDHIMVILITGYSTNSEHVVKGLSKGAVDYLFKPLDLYITIAKVNSLITLVNYQKEIQKKNQELEKYQEELFIAIEKTEKNRAIKENFLANMSHEIRTPLNAIIGLNTILKDSLHDLLGAEQEEMFRLMEFSSNALLGIVNDILESAKIDAGKVEIIREKTNIINLTQTICDLARPMADEKGLELICEIDIDVPIMVMVDSLRMNQILMNLINNAIKFTQTGSVRVYLNAKEKKDNEIKLEFIVKDTGIGIPKESIEHIFTRFEQVEDKTWQKFGGTGLGLSIVKRLIKLKGGTLTVESEIGAGTAFTFTNWYQLADDFKRTEPIASHSPQKFDNILILLAEDNLVNQFIVVEMLKNWNIRVDIANNGIEVIEKLTNNDYKLILMDTHMPLMNGYEATRKIRQEMVGSKKNTPIISFSASVIEKEKTEAKNAGVDDFLEKPFKPENLIRKIRNLTQSSKNVQH